MFCLHYSVIYKPCDFDCTGGINLFFTDLNATKVIHEQLLSWKSMFSMCSNSENKSWLPFLISSKEHEEILNWRSNYEGTASQIHSKYFTKHICSGEHSMDNNQVLLLNLCMF